ncbi:MAG: GspE/PulE family protein, partial [Candidatus Babeliales bacterium]
MKQVNLGEIVSPVELVDTLINQAVHKGASDIHLESTEKGLRIRFRVDGMLFDHAEINKELMPQVLSRIKVLAHINLAEKRVPQDGKFRMIINEHPIDMRVSMFPSVYGQKAVIRILDRSKTMIHLDHLGFDPYTLARFRQLINKPQGFLIVTGPTGSGKTTTLYGALAELNSPEKNIVTLEDPVEYHLDGIVQGNIHPDAGFTFAKGIRSILRQDPDIALVGEVRDQESARIAIEAALTGHLVLSTLHTNDAPGAIMRLMDMAIEPFLINAAVSGVLAQRLARQNCKGCTESYAPGDEEKGLMERFEVELPIMFKGNG